MSYAHFAAIIASALFIGGHASAATEIEQRAAVEAATQRSFLAGDFEQLEAVSRKYRTQKSRTSSGLWNLTLFYAGIDAAIENQTRGQDTDASFDALEERTRKWILEFPDSPTAHIAHGIVLIDRAWAYRGGDMRQPSSRNPGFNSGSS